MKKVMWKNKNYRFFVILTITTILIVPVYINAQGTIQTIEKPNNKTSYKNPSLSVNLANKNLNLGKPIELNLTVRNRSNSTINFFDAEPTRAFDITVKDVKGVSLPLTEEGQKKKFPIITMGRAGLYIEPGKELKFDTIRLDRLFDFKQAGNYTVEVEISYYCGEDSNKQTVSGNAGNILSSTIKFEIK